jgi:molybdopterin-guanine dinucleotide biosynthesis protein B
MHELHAGDEPPLAALLRRLSPVDLVLVEGFKAERHPKLEVHRAANAKPFLFDTLANVKAVASDVPVPNASLPVIALDDIAAVAELVLASAEPIATVLAALETPNPSQPSRSTTNYSGPAHG